MHVSQQKKLRAQKLRGDIYRYLAANLGIKQTQVADKFGISPAAASVHVRAIRDGWKPEETEGQQDVS